MTTYAVRNPRTGSEDYQFESPSSEDVASRSRGLREAQLAWQEGGVEQRVSALQAFADALRRDGGAVVEALSVDTGRIAESQLELDNVLSSIDRWCGLAGELTKAQSERDASMPGLLLAQNQVPYPLVGVISPWNFPLLLAFVDALPALLAGSAVLLKPSEVTPRFVEPLQQILDGTELAKVLAVIPGGAETGRDLIDQVDVICFTGSTQTGRLVAGHAAQRLIPAFLELGGKDAAVVTDDVDIDRTARALIWGSMVNAGQSCLSIERAYLNEAVADALEARLAEGADRLQLNAEDMAQGQIGPVIRREQADLIQQHIEDARERGARILCGGTVENRGGGGLWVQPTIVADCTPDMRIVSEETFGPVLAVARVTDDEAAIDAVNSSRYGLSGAVFCRDRERARSIAARMACGAVSINDAALTALVHEGEKNAFGESGLGGSRMGPAGLTRFLRKQLLIENVQLSDQPWWFAS